MASRELTGLQEMEECIKTGYTVVDCYGDFCAACVMLAPVFEAAAGEMAEIKFAKLNVTTHADVAEKYGIMAMPTLLFFRDGVLVHQVIGSLDKRDLRDQIAIMLYQ